MKSTYRVIARDGAAKSALFTTVHGEVKTPVFMNVATAAAIKGGVSSADLEGIGTQIALCNTYHLRLRPGDDIVYRMGGVRAFMDWHKPVLTDSGGFQVFSLSERRRITEQGVEFRSHIDGRKLFMGPEESMRIQSHLGSTIAMAFDECPPALAERDYVQASVDRTTRWLFRCIRELQRLNGLSGTVNPDQLLFGINQGAVYDDIRIEHAKRIAALDLPGYAIGGLAVGETHAQMYQVLEQTVPHLPAEKPVYLMGVGTPENILEGVRRGVDFFDCVYPSRNGRHGHVYTAYGKLNLMNRRFATDERPPEEGCPCPACRRHSRAYIHHLFKAGELLGKRLAVLHNLCFYNRLMSEIREAIAEGAYDRYADRRIAEMHAGESEQTLA
ncbi:MAG: tRNA guanosine(34) transglycosylase Tgt [Lachnospiraceae bacterium]|nr:tRNA guanosine(34) transglycosylase Tgt [Lachnospiraceae bacterium]